MSPETETSDTGPKTAPSEPHLASEASSLCEHVTAIAAISAGTPVVLLIAGPPGGARTLHIHHGPALSPSPLGPAEDDGAPMRLADGTRLAFRHDEPLVTRDGRLLGALRLFDVVPRSLSAPQQQVISRLARQAADILGWWPQEAGLAPQTLPLDPGEYELHALALHADPVLALDPQFALKWSNLAARIQLGLGDDAFEGGRGGGSLWDHLPEAMGGPFYDACQRVRRTRVAEHVEDDFPLRGRRAVAHILPEGNGVLILVRDVTDERALAAALQGTQAQFRALSQRLQSAQEEERRRISRELHDVVGQDLSVIKMRLELLKKRLLKSLPNDDLVGQCQDIIHDTENALAAARRLATDLRPSILDQLGLNAAIHWQAQEMERRTGIRCLVQTDAPDVRQHGGRDTTAFRALQELLTNVLRHAEARQIDIRLSEREGALCLEVQDDGRGFDGLTGPPTDGLDRAPPALGLLGVRERVGALGGSIEIESKAGQGTRVRITLPPNPTENDP